MDIRPVLSQWQGYTFDSPDERVYALREWAQRIAVKTAGTADDHLTGLLGEDALAQLLDIADRLNTEVSLATATVASTSAIAVPRSTSSPPVATAPTPTTSSTPTTNTARTTTC